MMKSNVRIVNRFKGYSLADCACVYCLYYTGKKTMPCSLKKCCCQKERSEAAARERQRVNIQRTLLI